MTDNITPRQFHEMVEHGDTIGDFKARRRWVLDRLDTLLPHAPERVQVTAGSVAATHRTGYVVIEGDDVYWSADPDVAGLMSTGRAITVIGINDGSIMRMRGDQ